MRYCSMDGDIGPPAGLDMSLVGGVHGDRRAHLPAQDLLEVEVPGLVARRIRIRRIGCQHLGSTRAQLQRLFVDTKDFVEIHALPACVS